MSVVVTGIARPAPNDVEALGRFGVATIHEAQGRTGLMQAHMRPIYPGAHICGPAVTVSLPPADNWMIHVAVEHCQAGDVLVVAPTSPSDAGYFGELLATSLAVRGVQGAGDRGGLPRRRGAHRDALSRVVAGGLGAGHGQGDARLGERAGRLRRRAGQPGRRDRRRRRRRRRRAACHASRRWHPAAAAREAKEDEVRARLKAGELGLDIYGMRERLAAKGLRTMSADKTEGGG